MELDLSGIGGMRRDLALNPYWLVTPGVCIDLLLQAVITQQLTVAFDFEALQHQV